MKRAGAWLALFVLLAGVAGPAEAAAPTPDQRRRDIQAEVRRLREELGETADEEAELVAELEVSRRLRRDLDARVAELDGAIATAEQELAAVGAELDAAIQGEREARAAVLQARRQVADALDRLRAQAVDAFIRFGAEPNLQDLLADLEDVNDAPRVAAYVDAVAERQADVVDELRRLQEDSTLLEADAAAAKLHVATRQQEALARKATLEQARREQDAARTEVAAEAATEQRLLAEVQARQAAYEQRIRALERESSTIEAELRRRQAGQAVRPSGKGVFAAPTANPQITSSFGYRVHPIYGDRRLHAGIDLRAPTGTAVYAAGAGTVAFAGVRGGYGNTVIIDHGGATATLYAHNSAIAVSVGQQVARGQRIASAGSTGNSTGPHVHFEVRVNGAPVDPMRYL